jgi:uracil-DNA glycosylase
MEKENSKMDNQWQTLEETIINCRQCPRLVAWREKVAVEKRRAYMDWDYWGKPVPGFGDKKAPLLVVGLAPGAHGSNRTGRMFTGDSSGIFLYSALHRAGFANQPISISREDNLNLENLFITAICRCAPPDNKPLPQEQINCRPFLLKEMELLGNIQGIIVLGKIAFDQVLTIYRLQGIVLKNLEFSHGAFYSIGEGLPWLLASYHPSRQNTQTGRLTSAMFDSIWQKANNLLKNTEK